MDLYNLLFNSQSMVPAMSPGNPAETIPLVDPGQMPTGGMTSGGMPIYESSVPEATIGGAAPTGAAGPGFDQRLLAGMRGVQMPAAPTPQRISTPAAPRPTGAIQPGADVLLKLLMAAQQPQQARPATMGLGQAIGR